MASTLRVDVLKTLDDSSSVNISDIALSSDLSSTNIGFTPIQDVSATNVQDAIAQVVALIPQDIPSDLINAPIANIAASGTIDLTTGAAQTSQITITGTGVNINGFTVAANRFFVGRMAAGNNTLVNSASLITDSGANIRTSAGDSFLMRSRSENVVEILCYVRASNSNVLRAANGWYRLPSGIIEQWGVYTVNTGGLKTITLPISFTTANYGALVSDTTTSSSSAKPTINALSLNDFTAYIDSSTINNPLGVVFWRCWGF